jgi:hypothetical protein
MGHRRDAKEKVVHFAWIRNFSECDFLCGALGIAGAFHKAAEDCARVASGASREKKNHDAEKKHTERDD